MARNGFTDKKVASEAGKKGKRGKGKYANELKKILVEAVETQFKTLPKDLADLKKKDLAQYFKAITKLTEFVLPKNLDITTDGDKISITPIDFIKTKPKK